MEEPETVTKYDFNKDFEKDLYQCFQSAFQPHDKRPIYEWANEHVTLDSGYSIKGKFDCSISPHFKQIFDAYQDPYVREVNILAPPRSGKTTVAEICLLHSLANSDGDILWLQLSDDMAGKMSDLRMMPLIRSCPPVAQLIDANNKFSITEARYKFQHSTVHLASPNGDTLNSVGYKRVFSDEPYKYKGEAIFSDIKRRTDDYAGVSKCLFFSQGGNKYSPWYEQFHSGQVFDYGWTCPKCEKLQLFRWNHKHEDGTKSGMVWPDHLRDENGNWKIKECAEQTVLKCCHCFHTLDDNPQNRRHILFNGDYIDVSDKNANPKIKSFRFTNLCNVKISFATLTTRFLTAIEKDSYGNRENLEEFITRDLADWWDSYTRKSRTEIRSSTYDTDAPFGAGDTSREKFRFLTVDIQEKDPKFYWVCRAWTGNGESRMVAYGTANSWKEIDAIRERHQVEYKEVFVDTGNKPYVDGIYAECVKYGRDYNFDGVMTYCCYNSTKGSGLPGFHHSDNKHYRYKEPSEITVATENDEDEEKSLIHYTWSNLRIKQILEALRDGKGKKWESANVSEEYTLHLNSEILQRKLKGNKDEFEYVQKPNTPNHWWDCECLQVLAADIFGCLESREISSDELEETKTE
jgi:Phage terminase large subunit (GpA)